MITHVVTLYRLIPRQSPLGDWRTDPFGHPVLRQVVLTLQVGENGNLSGEYQETISGLLGAPFTVSGTVFLRREGDEDDFAAFLLGTAPTVPDPPVQAQISSWCAAHLRCPNAELTICAASYPTCVAGDEASCPSALILAKAIDQDLPSIESSFSASSPIINGFPVDLVDCCRDSMAAAAGLPQDFPPAPPACAEECLDPHLSECLQSVFEHNLTGGIHDPGSEVPELTLVRNLMNAGLFVASDSLVEALEMRIEGMGFQDELGKLDQVQSDLAWLEQRMLRPGRLAALQGIPFTIYQMDHYDLFSKLFRLETMMLETLSHRAKLKLRQGLEPDGDIRQELQSAAEVTYLRGVAVAEVLRLVGGDPAPALSEHDALAQALTTAARSARDMSSGRNVLGLSPEYVPFLYRPGDQGLTNFEQVFNHVSSEILAGAKTDEDAAKASVREFEQNQYTVTTAISDVNIQYNEQLSEICGTVGGEPDVANCGTEDGSLKLELQSLEYEQSGVDLVETRLVGLKTQIQIELDRAAAVSGVRDGNIRMIQENGEVMAAMTVADSVLSSIQTFLSIASNSNALNFGTPTGLGAISAVIQLQRGMIAAEKERLQTMERARMEAATQQIELINSQATVKNLLLQMSTVAIEVMMQQDRVNQPMSRIIALKEKVKRLVATRDMLILRAQNNPAADPSFRLTRDRLAEQAEASFERAQEWVYLAARAFEYETNTDFPCIESHLYRVRTAAGLQTFMTNLMANFTAFRAAYGSPQVYVDEISVRQDVFGISQALVDPVTGEEISPLEQFRRLLLSGDNKDGHGGVSLPFSSSISAGNGVFSSLLCNDRIKDIQVMLVGDFLGDNEAGVVLSQAGSSLIRSCNPTHTGTLQELVEYNIDDEKASIQAGVNTYGLAPASTAFYGRSVAFSSWRVSIPSGSEEPNNADLDLTHLDDIVIKVGHEALTVDDLSGNEFVPFCQ
ncbi:MAG: hypothetical protein RBU30_26580 [Polyangia bacterium]|nr:hypothetical protein [Polyangia bacterium]